MSTDNTLKNLTCNCCNREDQPVIGVASSGIVPMSFAWCAECLNAGAEPSMVLSYLKYDIANERKENLRPEALQITTWVDGEYKTLEELWDVFEPPLTEQG